MKMINHPKTKQEKVGRQGKVEKKQSVNSLQHADIWEMVTHQGQLPMPNDHPYPWQDHMHLPVAAKYRYP